MVTINRSINQPPDPREGLTLPVENLTFIRLLQYLIETLQEFLQGYDFYVLAEIS